MLSVLKIGGSILRRSGDYAIVARFLADRLAQRPAERLVVIVSAQYGVTDGLLAEATEILATDEHRSMPATDEHRSTLATDQHRSIPLPADALDLLWSTGEIRSVALLALHLERLGVRPAALNVHQAGLTAFDGAAAGVVDVRPLHLLSALGRARIAIVPGFFAVRPGGAIASLGRGGSDLTAVLLASALRAEACELVKDVPGYFTADPHVHADAVPIHQLAIDDALAMAANGCDLVQPAALVAARDAALTIVVRSLDSSAHVTFLLPRSAAHGVRNEDDSRRAAVGA